MGVTIELTARYMNSYFYHTFLKDQQIILFMLFVFQRSLANA